MLTIRLLVDSSPSEPSQETAPNSIPSGDQTQAEPAVRFRSTIEEIDPKDSCAGSDVPANSRGWTLGDPADVTPEQIRDLSNRLKACPLQERRMNIFSYEAFSLPASRVCCRRMSHWEAVFIPAYSKATNTDLQAADCLERR